MLKIKNMVFGLAAFIAALSFAGCTAKAEVEIENISWTMTTAQRSDGTVVACAPDLAESYKEAEPMDIICRAEGGSLAIRNKNSSDIWAGVYTLEQTGADTIYSLKLEGNVGSAVCSNTVDNSGQKQKTLVLSAGGYTMYFFGTEL